MDKRIKVLIISTVVLITGAVAISIFANKENNINKQEGTPELTVKEKKFDLGTVLMANGLAKHVVELKNTGTSDLKINSIKTSCMCTEAMLEVDNEKSPKFGMHTSSSFWSQKIKPNQTANLEIIFDPNAHGPNATGPITRTVTLLSNDNNKSNTKTIITFTGNVVK